jgi:hypothetical protein
MRYLVAGAAARGIPTYVSVVAFAVLAADQEEADARASRVLEKVYPRSDGWAFHEVSVVPDVPSVTIDPDRPFDVRHNPAR